MDGFDNTTSTVAAFHALGQHVICYVDVGTWESWRSDAQSFAASVLGNELQYEDASYYDGSISASWGRLDRS